jgi:hypothetical protein
VQWKPVGALHAPPLGSVAGQRLVPEPPVPPPVPPVVVTTLPQARGDRAKAKIQKGRFFMPTE